VNILSDRHQPPPARPRHSDNGNDLRLRTAARADDASSGERWQPYRADVWRPESRAAASWPGIALWIGLTVAAAALGTLASSQAADFYAELAKPAWAPPAPLFGPVWSLLYVLMAAAAVTVWRVRETQPRARLALALYAAALVPNALWPWTFFAWHLGGVSLAVIAVLTILLLWTVVAFKRVRMISALLMLPVLAWVTFAAALNARLWQLNPGLL
jgi:tryptophan-rich sensory protein